MSERDARPRRDRHTQRPVGAVDRDDLRRVDNRDRLVGRVVERAVVAVSAATGITLLTLRDVKVEYRC